MNAKSAWWADSYSVPIQAFIAPFANHFQFLHLEVKSPNHIQIRIKWAVDGRCNAVAISQQKVNNPNGEIYVLYGRKATNKQIKQKKNRNQNALVYDYGNGEWVSCIFAL